MAVEAKQQFSENPSLHVHCNTTTTNSLGWVDSKGLPLDMHGSIEQQLRQQQQQQQMLMAMTCSPLANQQLLPMGYSYSNSSNNLHPMDFNSVASLIEKQKQEIDQFLCLQSEQLRGALQQQGKQHLLFMIRRFESKSAILVKHKEEELLRARKKTAELEESLRRTESENQTWQRIAKENEALALALNNMLEQVRDNACVSPAGTPAAVVVDDTASCCDSSSGSSDLKHVMGICPCKWCGSMDSCMILVPCLHLCFCKFCDGLFDSCPVCKSVKQDSIEVLFA